MKSKISSKGYTNVILILNMKRFIAAKDQKRFESIRGTPEFARVLRNGWWNAKKKNLLFVRMSDEKRQEEGLGGMSTAQVGFATGVFRALFLEPRLSMERISSLQVKRVFLRPLVALGYMRHQVPLQRLKLVPPYPLFAIF